MPTGLLVNELLANAFKYAFEGRETGTISLECLREDDERYRIIFADNGVGFARGTTWPTPGKLGALILQTLRENTRELSFRLMSEPGEGARMTIEFLSRPALQRAS
jgi:two-component sensor histidine kinase